ncbi:MULTISPECIES: alpha/beta fold hydrolase [unclassified Microcoleus]|uniref:alpha/beta fold hydrolase n=1 Tax=unclassified Microcoleus TaxID=2642155 RepID=UPI0025D97291|nr:MULTISPECIES: alpha/beta fold hydrolase [unclassified Microcoleus]
MKIPDRYIKVDSINTRYWSTGTQGSPVILLHGGGSSIEIWEQNIQALAHHHRVFAFDMVGTGLSDKPAGTYSLDYQLQFLKAFLDRLEIQTASLIGNSMGGSIALKFALELPERVSNLGLISSFGLGQEIDIADRLLAAFPAIAKRIPPSRTGVRMVLNSCVYDPKSVPESLIELNYQRFNLPGQKEALISLLVANLDFWGVRREVFSPLVQHLDRIKIPTLIIWGKQDSIIPVAHAYVASQKIVNSQLYVFERCGHWAQVEYPEKFNRLVLEFLA